MLRSKLFQNGKPEFPIVKDTTLKSTLTLPTKPSMIIFDSKQNRPNLLRDFGRLFDVIFQWIVLYMKKLTIHHYGWVTIPSTVYSVKKCYNRLSWTRCGWMNVQSGYLNQIARLCPFRRFFVVTIVPAPTERNRNVRISAVLQSLVGVNVVLEVPCVIFCSTAQSTAL